MKIDSRKEYKVVSFEKEHVLTKKKFFCSWFTGNKKTTMWSRSTARSFSEYGAFCRLYFYLLRLNKYSIDLLICFKLEKTPYSHVFHTAESFRINILIPVVVFVESIEFHLIKKYCIKSWKWINILKNQTGNLKS